ncbi:hypothetical protein QE152_g3637 [Popillia japonica]|uniref:C2H2-type domain-containing protein n=1 Tax=Popillia japonica TaxID=7064 RepID=A0AAW1N3S1_POPJA
MSAEKIVGKEFDASFTIPRKKEEIEDVQPTSILANVYTLKTDGRCSGPARNHVATSVVKSDPKPDSSTSALKRSWLDANITRANQCYRDTFKELYDPTLPAELLSLFQPLFCKLCMFQLSGNSMAKLHYQSKNHDKKVRAWLIEYSERTGEPLHKRAAVPRTKRNEEYNPKYYHCDICDLALTGKAHAESHYMGKNHQRAVAGKKAPAGKGYYNDEGKWIRTEKDPTGDNFGAQFAKKKKTITNWKCKVCDVSVTSASQLEVHIKGTKHKKKLKMVGTDCFTNMIEESDELYDPEQVDDEEEEAPTLHVVKDVLSAYRTPSGHYYCKICNLSLNSEFQFTEHLRSKKHGKKSFAAGIVEVEPSATNVVTSSDDIFDHL